MPTCAITPLHHLLSLPLPFLCSPHRPFSLLFPLSNLTSIWLTVRRVSRPELFSPLFHGLLVYLLCELSNYIFLLYTRGNRKPLPLFSIFIFQYVSFWCSYVFLLKAKKKILIFLTLFLNEGFYSIILIVITDKPEFISAILFHTL